MTKYRIFDTQLQDYVAPYDEDEKYWTLNEAKDLAYRKQDEVCDMGETKEDRKEAVFYLNKIALMITEEEIAEALSWFGYELERAKQ